MEAAKEEGRRVGSAQGFALGLTKGVRVAAELAAEVGEAEAYGKTVRSLIERGVYPGHETGGRAFKLAERLETAAKEVRLEPHNEELSSQRALCRRLKEQLRRLLDPTSQAVNSAAEAFQDLSF